MRCCFVLLTLICASLLSAQDLVPRPYAFAGGKSMGGGYAPLAADRRRRHSHRLPAFSARRRGSVRHRAQSERQRPAESERTQSQTGGFGVLPLALSWWSFGAGVRWSQLSTTNYTKSSWAPTFGGSKDYFHNALSAREMRARLLDAARGRLHAGGSNWRNGAQGASTLSPLYVPSPSGKTHIFRRETVGI